MAYFRSLLRYAGVISLCITTVILIMPLCQIQFDTIFINGVGGRYYTSSIKTQSHWTEQWDLVAELYEPKDPRTEIPLIDFEKREILSIHLGNHRTSCFEFGVYQVFDLAILRFVLVQDNAEGVCQSLSSPLHIISYPRTNKMILPIITTPHYYRYNLFFIYRGIRSKIREFTEPFLFILTLIILLLMTLYQRRRRVT